MKKLIVAVPVLALALGGTTACATKKMVRTQVGEVNGKVETLAKSVEENQERTRANEGRIGEVDQKAQAAGQRADAANKSAAEARAAADAVNTRADAIEKASKRLVYEVTLSEDKGGFKFGKAAMPDEAKADLDSLVQKLKSEPNGAFIEIEGHTDNAGPHGSELQAWPRSRRSGQALSLRAAPGAAPQDQRDQLRRGKADRAEQDESRSRPEPPRRHQGSHLDREFWPPTDPRLARGSVAGAVDRERSAGGLAGMVRRHVRG